MVASLRDKSLTYDELAHAASGYSYWRYGDFRLQPENGQLPQRVAGLPLLLSVARLPSPDPAAWRNAEQWQLGAQWFYRSGCDARSLSMEGRALCGLFAVALGALVWAWSRRLFGPVAGMLSLLLFVLSPTVLANGALMTSDTAAALFFAATAWAMASLVERPSLARLALSSLLMGALFLTKVSAVLVVPLVALLIAARIADRRPLAVRLPGFPSEIVGRWARIPAFGAAVVVHAILVIAIIWAGYGFRYSAFSDTGSQPGRFRMPWEYLLAKTDPLRALDALGLSGKQASQAGAIMVAGGAAQPVWSNWSIDALRAVRRDVLTPEQSAKLDGILARPSHVPWVRAVEWVRDHRLLPEAWIYGFTDVYRRSLVRPAFLNGDFRMQGWIGFFPYTFLVKTPVAVFAIGLLALGAVGWGALSWERVWPVLSLLLFLVIYWGAAVTSHLNIGHRHLMPVYAPLFILMGGAAHWIGRLLAPGPSGPTRRWPGWAVLALVAALVAEDAAAFPNYLAYFNGVVPAREGYRHLVDSSLDWGQDLPAVRSYIDAHPGLGPFYFSYFGTASPAYHGIQARQLYSVAGLENKPSWRNLVMEEEEASAELPRLPSEWPDHDVIGERQIGSTVIVTLLRKPESLSLHPGTYLISASMLEPVNFPLSGPFGPWNSRYESTYQQLRAAVAPLESEDRETRLRGLRAHSANEWAQLLDQFDQYRFGRLTAYLRQREPDQELNYSVMVYHLGTADLSAALEGPMPESGPDLGTRERDRLPEVEALP
jgi:hypothetical protein